MRRETSSGKGTTSIMPSIHPSWQGLLRRTAPSNLLSQGLLHRMANHTLTVDRSWGCPPRGLLVWVHAFQPRHLLSGRIAVVNGTSIVYKH